MQIGAAYTYVNEPETKTSWNILRSPLKSPQAL